MSHGEFRICTDGLHDISELVHHRHVLELGAGIGFLGIIISKLQSSSTATDKGLKSGSIVMTDVDENVLERNRSNVSLPPSKLQALRGSHLVPSPRRPQMRFAVLLKLYAWTGTTSKKTPPPCQSNRRSYWELISYGIIQAPPNVVFQS